MWQKIKNLYHLAQALFAAVFYHFPSKKLTVIGVTGTDGKTTTVNMISFILNASGLKTSHISSVNAQIGNKAYNTGFHVSTPSPWQVQKYLKKAVDSGSKYFILETTSHGLDQNRLAFIDFEVGVITNVTHEHLDYHKTWQNYLEAKAKLFRDTTISVLNEEDDSFTFLKAHAAGKIVSYGKNNSKYNLKNTNVKLKIIGTYNLSNALASIAATVSLGVKKEKAQKSLSSFPGVSGRMEEIDLGQDFRVFIDFAHTPNALENALKSLKPLTVENSALIAVFGAAGERDRGKRPKMGSVSAKHAAITVLTSEDPRSESAAEICKEIARGMKGKKEGKDYHIILDRKNAIEFAIDLANKNAVIGVFGKGHEKSMNMGKKELPWDEFETTKIAIERKLNG